MRKVLFGAALLALSAGAQAQVYKCVDGQGKVTFSQAPCPGQASEPVDVKIDKSRPAPARSTRSNSQLREFDRISEGFSQSQRNRPAPRPQAREEKGSCIEFDSTELRTLIVKRQVVRGMTRDNALSAWGKPERINGDQYVYHWPEASAYFYVDNHGCVYAVQGSFRGK